jgi:secreted trypsin-like serine protease
LLTVIGWGNTNRRTNHPNFPDQLREVRVPVVNEAQCDKAYKGFIDPATMLCAGEKGSDSCQGDSGGPLFATTSAGTRIQMGVTSFGIGCAKDRYPGVYADINGPTIRNFIRSTAGV